MEQYGRPARKPSAVPPPHVAFLYPASCKPSKHNAPSTAPSRHVGFHPTKPNDSNDLLRRPSTPTAATGMDSKQYGLPACNGDCPASHGDRSTDTPPKASSPQGDMATSRDALPNNMVAVVHKVRPSTASAVKSTRLTYMVAAKSKSHHRTDDHEVVLADPDTSIHREAVPPVKLRPRTAAPTKPPPLTAHSSCNNNDANQPHASPCTTLRTERPETSSSDMDLSSGRPDDLRYIDRLKDDIKTIHTLLAQSEASSTASAPSNAPLPSTPSVAARRHESAPLPPDVRATFARCNHLNTSDRQALDHAKRMLEQMLSDSLMTLIANTLPDDSVLECRPVEAFGGDDAGTVYLSNFLCLSRRAERLKHKCVAEKAEKACVQAQLDDVHRQLADAHDDIVLFKDELDKIRGRPTSSETWARLRSEVLRRRGSLHDATSPVDHDAVMEKNKGLAERAAALEQQCALIEAQYADLQSAHAALTRERAVAAEAQLQTTNELEREQAACAELRHTIAQNDVQLQTFAATVQSLRAQLEQGSVRLVMLESDLAAAQAQLCTARQDVKSKINEVQAAAKTQLDQAADAARQNLCQLQHAWETRLAEVEQSQQMQLHTVESLHARALTTQSEAFDAERKAWETERVAAQRQITVTVDQLQRVQDALEAEKARSHTMTNEWTARLDASSKELENAQRHVHDLDAANLQLKLAVSETKISLRHDMETTWLQQIAALEHALAQARAKLDAEREQFHLELQTERDRVKHVVDQAKSVSDELETANLCLAERKRQREIDQEAYEAREKRASDAIARLTDELREALQTKPSLSKRDWDAEIRQLHQHNDELVAKVQALSDQVQRLRQEKIELERRTSAAHDQDKAQLELAVRVLEASNVDLGHQLSIARGALADLERQLHKAKEECQLMEMAATESRLQHETRLNERLGMERRMVQKQQLDLDMATQTMMEEKQLLQQVVQCLNDRLKLQLELLAKTPHDSATMPREGWAHAQTQWQRVQEKLDEMTDAPATARLPPSTSKRPANLKQSPFSDAIAAGQRAVAVAEKLHQPDNAIESDSFAAALAKEMKTMKDTYEARLHELSAELKRVQNMRCDHTARLQHDLADEKLKHAAMVGHLEEKCAGLEKALAAHMTAMRRERDEEIDLICRSRVERDGKAKVAVLEALLECRAKACSDELQRRMTVHDEVRKPIRSKT
ncbi:hypothetical protein, variant 1 [Aphanomyces invadans]|uniref:Uncharacterized protein n=1 Tax=Aphanomyces invadans TaxID=157072 RepID=A0A024TGZ6_9STRA|nr:hypothetical protein, variant 1 [Aphanomyces invadans]ETV92632.1 hypothetical protein, variant 1 [Aphanomyces invadans]|eukprot:XP_008878667.1 hypothetical protein, variant 1 [Aphanomyces invadans]